MPSKPLTEPVLPTVLSLVEEAKSGRLAIYAGAGVSAGSDLPSGPKLAAMIHKSLDGQLAGYACDQTTSLTEVAEAIACLPDGLEILQQRIVSLAPFDCAIPNLAHQLLALLLAEGATKVITTNWDDCLERGWKEERIQAARSAAEATDLRRAHVLKVHGCCTLPSTLLVTKTQLATPPLWVEWSSWNQITSSTVVFVGVGDVAPYVREPIALLTRGLQINRIRVVSRSINVNWDTSEWHTILPSLPPERRLGMRADEFMDQLARGWILANLISRLDFPDSAKAMHACFLAFKSLSALEILAWMRFAATRSVSRGWLIGESVARSAEALGALQSLGVIAEQFIESNPGAGIPAIRFTPRASLLLSDSRIEVLIARSNQSTASIERDARRRAESVANETGISKVTVLCSAVLTTGPRQSQLPPADLLSVDVEPGDLIAGPTQVSVEVLWADRILEAWRSAA